MIAEEACTRIREHAAEGRVVHRKLLGNILEQPQRVIRVVEPERSVDDGQDDLQLRAGGHAWDKVGSRHCSQLKRGEGRHSLAAIASAVDERGAAVERARQHGCAGNALSQLAWLQVAGYAKISEQGEGDLVDDGDPVFRVGGELGISANGDQTVDGQRNLDVAETGVGGIAWNQRSIGIGEVEVDLDRDKGVRRCGADIEAADIRLAATVNAVSRRCDLAAESIDMRELQAHAEDVAAFPVNLDALHGVELAECDDRGDVLNIATRACDLHGYVEIASGVRAYRTVQAGVAEAGRDGRSDDAVQLIRAFDARAERQRLEYVSGVVVECLDGSARKGIRDADARDSAGGPQMLQRLTG